MSIYVAKAAVRQAKNLAKGFTDIQSKVREATSNDPWGPSGTQMAELADASFHGHEFTEIMEMLDKRLNDSGKNWRHVFKALTLLDYMIHCGSEQVIAYAKQNLYVIKTLKEFQYIDEEGKDQGANVREKSKAIAALLADDERLKEERRARASLRDRMGTAAPVHDSHSFSSSGSPAAGGNAFGPSTSREEESQLERAIEESKRTAEEHERRMRERSGQNMGGFSATDDSSRRQAPAAAQQQQQQSQQVDLWGSHVDQKQTDLDFFSSMAVPTAVNSQQQADPFGFPAPSQQQQLQQQNLFGANPFGGQQQQASFASSSMAFSSSAAASFQPQQQQQFGVQPAYATPFQQPVAGNQSIASFQNNTAPFAQAVVPFQQQNSQNSFQQQNNNNNTNNNLFGGASFDAAFDTGAGQKNLVPRNLQGQQNPNAQLAQIARNATQIDPFANLAASGGGGGGTLVPTKNNTNNNQNNSMGDFFGGGSSQMSTAPNYNVGMPVSSVFSGGGGNNPFGGSQQQQSQRPPQQPASDPFSSLAPQFPSRPQAQQQQTGIGGQTPMMNSGTMYGNKQQQQQQNSFGPTAGYGGFSGQQQQPQQQSGNFFF